MLFLYGVLMGIGVATGACLIWLKIKKPEKSIKAAELENANFNPNPNVEIKRENLVKLEDLVSKQDKITNDEVQALLGISDATAERYLQALESQGKLRQIGADEKDTYYEKT